MSDIQQPRFSDGLRRLLGVRPGPVGDMISDELVATLSLNDAELVEQRALMGIKSWYAQLTVAALAGNRSELIVRNPDNSGQLSVIEGFKLTAMSSSVGVAPIRVAAGAWSVQTTARFRDTRLASVLTTQRPHTAFYARQGAAVATGGYIYSLATGEVNEEIEWWTVLAAGDSVIWQPANDNEALTMYVWGYERSVLTDERSLG